EQQFADEQQEKWIEIEAYLEAIATNSKKVVLSTGETISIPNGETPAYLEWILWRVFLAVDSLVNKPWEARRFKVDQDFLPVGVAASRGPDLIFEFERFVLVVEATLTSSSRQEAAEGEPVRRHVADIVEVYESKNKPVYGLFIANIVDSNTAETLRIGAWYRRDDSKMSLQIVPLTIGQLLGVVRSRTGSNKNTPAQIERLLRDCLAMSNLDAPAWKQAIQREVSRFISENSA
ncbi:MAG: AlwI family type II restriction endonuclease, partial [Candidatus Obscuribacterales bacterium]|nr:AlwI family type II restriction endonuclease [Candidatus Obscuribacterales bacterium]